MRGLRRRPKINWRPERSETNGSRAHDVAEVERALVGPPRGVMVRPEVLRSVASAAAAAGPNETGGPLIGTVQRTWHGSDSLLLTAVLATVSAGPNLDAGPATVALGSTGDGERAAAALAWWRSVTGLELVHLGDWHKHPSGCPEPSQGDCATAREMRARSTAPVWLIGVAVGRHSHREKATGEGNVARIQAQWASAVELRYYRAAARGGLIPLPVRVEGDVLPGLPPLPWHVTDPDRFGAECRLLDAAGYGVAIAAARPEDGLGLSLRVERNGSGPITVGTGLRYPNEAPKLVDEFGRRVPVRGDWSPGRFLVDLVSEVSTYAAA